VIIRHAEARSDAGACSEIYAPLARDSAVSFEAEAPSRDELARRIERVSLTHPWLVAEDDGSVVGYAYGSQHRERAAYRWAVDVAVYVGVEHRRRGVGRALYDGLLPLLSRQGFYSACAGITLPNDPSVRLHEACGFKLVGVYRRIGWKAGAWRDVGWWQRELRDGDGDAPEEPGPPARLSRD
jgi:phosphinothricin acetyltransferase